MMRFEIILTGISVPFDPYSLYSFVDMPYVHSSSTDLPEEAMKCASSVDRSIIGFDNADSIGEFCTCT